MKFLKVRDRGNTPLVLEFERNESSVPHVNNLAANIGKCFVLESIEASQREDGTWIVNATFDPGETHEIIGDHSDIAHTEAE